MIAAPRFRSLIWLAFADFFSAVALLAFALYGYQRQRNLLVEEPIHLFARELDAALRTEGLTVEYDSERSRLSLPEALLFATNKSKISDPGVVHKLARSLKKVQAANSALWGQTRSFHLVIRGHADARGTWYWNTALSQLRARTLEDALVSDGIGVPAFQISSQGVGAAEPKVDNCSPQTPKLRTVCPDGKFGTDAQLSPNRRIELRFGFFSGY